MKRLLCKLRAGKPVFWSHTRERIPRRTDRGGATFTMILFVLLIVSSGLMYFYFQRCRSLERELAKWRSGVKVKESAKAKPEAKNSITDIASVMREKIIGAPTKKTPEKKADAASIEKAKRAPQKTPEPQQQNDETETATEEPAAPPARQAPRASVAEAIEEPAAPEPAAETPRRTPAPERRTVKRAEAAPESADPRRRVIHSAYDAPQSFRGTTSQHSFDEDTAPAAGSRNSYQQNSQE